MTTGTYIIPTDTFIYEEEIRKSRFIASVSHADNRDNVEDFIAEVKRNFPGASHYCYGFIAGDPAKTSATGMSDDGEPKGTAGKPILNVLSHKGIGEVVVVVTRYYGGTKLGTGGLVRAYSGVTKKAVESVATVLKVPKVFADLEFQYCNENSVRKVIGLLKVETLASIYTDKVLIKAAVPLHQKEEFKENIREITNGSVIITYL